MYTIIDSAPKITNFDNLSLITRQSNLVYLFILQDPLLFI